MKEYKEVKKIQKLALRFLKEMGKAHTRLKPGDFLVLRCNEKEGYWIVVIRDRGYPFLHYFLARTLLLLTILSAITFFIWAIYNMAYEKEMTSGVAFFNFTWLILWILLAFFFSYYENVVLPRKHRFYLHFLRISSDGHVVQYRKVSAEMMDEIRDNLITEEDV